MEYYKTCPTCDGRGKVRNDSYCANVQGHYMKTCDTCHGNGIRKCTDYVVDLEKHKKQDENLKNSVNYFIENLKYFNLI